MNRYHRQILLPQIGPAGQERLAASKVLLIGCGALGSVIADQLVRAGVGSLRLVDRDIVEWTNLQRQVLFDESDAAEGIPKAIAAARRLQQVNSSIRIEPIIADVHPGNIEQLAGLDEASSDWRADLLLDGTDNVETRYLLNDISVKNGIPWVYGACVGTEGRIMPIRPGVTPCLRCIFTRPPGPGELPTCDTAGVLGPAAAIVASLQVTAAIRLLTGQADSMTPALLSLDIWAGRFRTTSLEDARLADCPACGLRKFEFLDNPSAGQSVALCGRNAIQIRPTNPAIRLDLALLAARLAPAGDVEKTPYLLRCRLREFKEVSMTLFPDGRAMIHGVTDPDRARSLYARWVGS